MICENCMWWEHKLGDVGQCSRKRQLKHCNQSCHNFFPRDYELASSK